MKIISFSLWGTNPKYTVGALRNAELAKNIYPDWVCRFYVARSVPQDIIESLENMDNTQVKYMDSDGDWTSMFWRFEPAAEDDVDIMISRDTDSRLSAREKMAVDEWVSSDKGFHIMRDHPWHKYPVLGGMWGVKKGVLPQMKKLISEFSQTDEYGTDYWFFGRKVYPLVTSDMLVHDPFFEGREFPSQRTAGNFVGQVFDENEQTVEEHVRVLMEYEDGNR